MDGTEPRSGKIVGYQVRIKRIVVIQRQFEIQGIGRANEAQSLRPKPIRMKCFSRPLIALRTFMAQIAGL